MPNIDQKIEEVLEKMDIMHCKLFPVDPACELCDDRRQTLITFATDAIEAVKPEVEEREEIGRGARPETRDMNFFTAKGFNTSTRQHKKDFEKKKAEFLGEDKPKGECKTCNGNGRLEMLEHCPDCRIPSNSKDL